MAIRKPTAPKPAKLRPPLDPYLHTQVASAVQYDSARIRRKVDRVVARGLPASEREQIVIAMLVFQEIINGTISLDARAVCREALRVVGAK